MSTDQALAQLKLFLATAPENWESGRIAKSHTLPNGEVISCVLWNNIFHITGTDICKIVIYRFNAFNRQIKNLKKFEEGIFSDLRNLKPNMDSSLEEPRSAFLEFLYKNQSVRTQKKQKVFYWFSVPHDRLFLDALERDVKRETLNIEAASISERPMPLVTTLQLAQQQCQPVEGGFKTDSFQNLPKHLNHFSAWKSNVGLGLQINSEPMQMPGSFIATPLATPFLSTDCSPQFSDLPTPASASDNLSPLPMMMSLFDEKHQDKKYEEDLQCSHYGCSRRFKRPEHLRRHMRTHGQKTERHKSMHEFLLGGVPRTLPSSPFLSPMMSNASPMMSNFEPLFSNMSSPFMNSLTASPFSPSLDMNSLSISSPLQQKLDFNQDMFSTLDVNQYVQDLENGSFNISAALEAAAPLYNEENSLSFDSSFGLDIAYPPAPSAL